MNIFLKVFIAVALGPKILTYLIIALGLIMKYGMNTILEHTIMLYATVMISPYIMFRLAKIFKRIRKENLEARAREEAVLEETQRQIRSSINKRLKKGADFINGISHLATLVKTPDDVRGIMHHFERQRKVEEFHRKNGTWIE